MKRYRASPRLALVVLIVALFRSDTGQQLPIPAQAANLGAVEGEVRSEESGQPIADAIVEAPELGLSARTDNGGRFAWRDIRLSEQVVQTKITVSALGFGDWVIEGVRIVAHDTLLLTVELDELPSRIVIPDPPLQRAQPPLPPDLEPAVGAISLPKTIRVRITGNAHCDTSAPYTVETIDFMQYVKNVLPNEWPAGWPGESYRAGAMVVKMYAWYWIARDGKWDDADVFDSTCDQVYIPGVAYQSTNDAVDFTWNWLLTRDGNLISIHYLDTSARCEDYGWDDCMGQWDTYWHALGNNGYDKLTWDAMLFRYYQNTRLDPVNPPPLAGFALRFYGNGFGDIDRVKIPIEPPVPADVGGDFTLEWWMRAYLAQNASGPCASGPNDGWINGNLIFDRDIFGPGDYGDYGISLSGGRITFGVNNGSESYTLCGPTGVANGFWHHIAVTRRLTGEMRIFIDGRSDAQATGPAGDISYRDGRNTSYQNSDPYLVIGAEKHDAGPEYPSFSGWIDEVRISDFARYNEDFLPPTSYFSADIGTVALYHFDEGFGNTINDGSGSSGGPSAGQRMYGGFTNGPEWVISDLFLQPVLFFPLISK